MDSLLEEFRELHKKLLKAGHEATLKIDPPATLAEVESKENENKRKFPDPLREFFLNSSKSFVFDWSIDEERAEIPEKFHELTFGECNFILDRHSLINWAAWEHSYTHPQYYGGGKTPRFRFEDLFPLLEPVNGDVIALHKISGAFEVVFLDHESGEIDEAILGDSFSEFLHDWITIGCVGPESWLIEPFVVGERLDVHTEVAAEYRQFLFTHVPKPDTQTGS